VELIEASKLAVNELIEVAGKTVIETALRMSVEHLIGPPHPGKPGAAIVRYGRQPGVVALYNRKFKVARPRIRRKGAGRVVEVEIPAYAANVAPPRTSAWWAAAFAKFIP